MILEALRRAIKNSDESRYRISQESGVDESVIHRVYHGGSCSVETADALCKHLGLELKPKAKKKRKRTKGLSKQALKRSEPLRLFMAGLKKTQKELAEDVGISRTAISKMLRGIQPISTEVKQYMKENH